MLDRQNFTPPSAPAEKPPADKKSKAKRILGRVTGVITAAVFLFLCFIILMIFVQKNGGKDVSLFGYYMLDVLTESMEPTISPGDVILSKKADGTEISEGDIVTFLAPSGNLKGKNITHRVLKIARDGSGAVDYILTKGDAADSADSWQLSAADIKAVYVKKLPFIAKLRDFMSEPAGYVVLIVLPLMLVVGLFMASYIKDRTKSELDKRKESPVRLEDLSEEERRKLLPTSDTPEPAASESSEEAESDGAEDVGEADDIPPAQDPDDLNNS